MKTTTDLKALLLTLPNREDAGRWKRGYTGWGPHEDYLIQKDAGWASNVTLESSRQFLAEFAADDLNVTADFYFSISRESRECTSCRGCGLNPESTRIERDFYDHDGDGSRRWCDKITQDEVKALQAKGRLHKGPLTAEEVNRANRRAGFGDLSHDGINRWILVETRARRLGVWGKCTLCKGKGWERLSEDYLVLNIWMMHPRKGATRAVEVKHVDPTDLPALKEYFAASWRIHERHFAWALSKEAK